MGPRVVVAVLALLLLPLALAPAASACTSSVGAVAIPCGRIYPIILVQTDAKPGTLYDLPAAAPLVVDATVTFTFDAAKDGYTATMPNEPVTISFEFPRKPQWVELAVDPPRIDVPVNDPTYFTPDGSDPANPKLVYTYTVPVKISVTLLGQAILKDGLDYHKLLVFAKSTESGIFQSGYGIKELRVVPEGALHEADVAGTRDVYVASPLPAQSPLEGVSRTFAGMIVTLAPPPSVAWWQPQPFELSVDPAPAGRMQAAVHDEQGHLVAQSPLLDASTGVAKLNVTLLRPGLHTATLTLLPEAGTDAPPMTYALDFTVGDLAVEGVQFPKTMLVAVSDEVPLPAGNRGGEDPRDALTQFERDVPFFAFDTAQSVTVALSLTSPMPGVVPGAANLQFSVLDPDGELLQTASVDPANPVKGYRIGSVPVEGWYTLRIQGAGLPVGGRYDAAVEVNYVQPAQARNRADGVPDPTPALLGMAGRNLSLPVDALRVWEPAALTPAYEGVGTFQHAVTIVDENGTLVQATRLRAGEGAFAAPWPGTFRAFVHVQPVTPGAPFSPLVRAFTFTVGANEVHVGQTFALEDSFETPVAADATRMGIYALPRDAGEPQAETEALAVATLDEAGVKYLAASTLGPTRGEPAGFRAQVDYASPVTLTGPTTAPQGTAQGGLPIPGVAVGLGLAVIGAAAVAVALLRRKA